MIDIVASIAITLWKMSLWACPVIILVLVIRLLLRRYPKKYCYGLWLLVLIRLLCPISVESNYSIQPELSFYREPAAFDRNTVSGADQVLGNVDGSKKENLLNVKPNDSNISITTGNEVEERKMNENVPGSAEDGTIENKAIRVHSLDRIAALQLIYILGVIIAFTIYLVQYIRIRKQVSMAILTEENVWLCESIESPFVMGVIHPRIYLPYGLGAEEKSHILKHERSHIRHHDSIFRTLATIALCFHYWNPLVWLAIRKMNEDMELYCDEGFMLTAAMEERRAYANTLLTFAKKKSGRLPRLSFGASATEQRVKNVMRKKKRNKLIIAGVILIAVIAVVLFMTIPKKGTSDVPSGGKPSNLSEDKEAKHPQTGNEKATENPNPGTGQEMNEPEGSTENGSVMLTEEDISYLEKMATVIPEFWETKDRTAEFWANLLFDLYYSDNDGETEDRYRFSEELGTTATYRKVSLEEVDALSEELFGDKMSDNVMPSEIPINTYLDIIYEDGYFYIGMESDGVAYNSEFVGMSESTGKNEATFNLKHVDSDWEGTVTLILTPAKNKRGFIITGKELTPVAKASGVILDNQVYKVSMNPLGDITFVAYQPVGTKDDVSFGLLKDEQEIYFFNVYDDEFFTADLEFKEIAEVSFPDYNSDGYTDVVVIADYDMGDSTLSLVRMFSGTDEGYFIWEDYLIEAYNNTHDRKSVEDVLSFVGKQENQMLFKGTSVIGSWQITKVAATSKVYALSEEEMNEYLNAYLNYGRYTYDFSIVGQEPLSGSLDGYKKESLTKEVFQSLYGIDKEFDGLKTERYDSYQVIGKKGDSVFGDTVILLDQDNAYIYYEGVFFLAMRIL